MNTRPDPSRDTRAGLAYGILAYGWWGLVPIYFKAVAHVPPLAVLAHRVVWSVAFLGIIIALDRWRWLAVLDAMTRRSTLLPLIGSTVMVSTNWLLFIHAVESGQVLQSSLGYFMTPLLIVAMAVVVLKERLPAMQAAAIALAAVGVAYMTVRGGQAPWLALGRAGSFATYGLLRKLVPVSPVIGLTVETSLLLPPALAIAAWQLVGDVTRESPVASPSTYGLLVLAGIITTVPLIAFAAAARRLPLTTIGFLQYLAPTGQFLLAVFLYGEPFTRTHAISFACIWAGLALFTISSVNGYRARASARAESPTPPID